MTRLAVLSLLTLSLALVSAACSQTTPGADGVPPSPEAAVLAVEDSEEQNPEALLAEAVAPSETLNEPLEAGAEVVVETSAEPPVVLDEFDERPDLSDRSGRPAVEPSSELAFELAPDVVLLTEKRTDVRARAAILVAEAKAQAEAAAKAAAEAEALAAAKAQAEAKAQAAKPKETVKQAPTKTATRRRAAAATPKPATPTPRPVVRAATPTPKPPVRTATPKPIVKTPTPTPRPPTTTSSGLGARAVSIAMRYLGYRYTWSGISPSTGFDCSGFTYYVYLQAGRPISRSLAGQYGTGLRVSRAGLQPGDLVFFQNTYKAGLSHSGLYIGNGRFINAQSERAGVAIGSVDSTYWGPRFIGGRRP